MKPEGHQAGASTGASEAVQSATAAAHAQREPDWVRCDECDTITHTSDLLHAPNPFDAEDIVAGCPFCKSIDCFRPVCDAADCHRYASSGTPTPDGYRWTCHKHRPTDAAAVVDEGTDPLSTQEAPTK